MAKNKYILDFEDFTIHILGFTEREVLSSKAHDPLQ